LTSHVVIPDVQVKPGNDVSYLRAIGEYILEKKPDKIILLGDFADMPSLSSYAVGKKSFEGRRYRDDIEAAQEAMNVLLAPIYDYNRRALQNKKKVYKPEKILLLGNHEDRINRAIENDAKLDGTIGIDDLNYQTHNWKVIPYRAVEIIDGIAYSHVFTTGVMGRPVTSARALVMKKHMSCIQGHNQKMEIYNEYRADGKMVTGLFGGCCYLHDEEYLGPQGNNYFRGIHMLYDVKDGEFHVHSITLDYLIKRQQSKRNTGVME
jgi:hypothetical protein